MTPIQFSVLMQRELQANAHKGDWAEWKPGREDAKSELAHHYVKLIGAICREDRTAITEFSADVANIAMKIAEVYGVPAPSPQSQPEGAE